VLLWGPSTEHDIDILAEDQFLDVIWSSTHRYALGRPGTLRTPMPPHHWCSDAAPSIFGARSMMRTTSLRTFAQYNTATPTASQLQSSSHLTSRLPNRSSTVSLRAMRWPPVPPATTGVTADQVVPARHRIIIRPPCRPPQVDHQVITSSSTTLARTMISPLSHCFSEFGQCNCASLRVP